MMHGICSAVLFLEGGAVNKRVKLNKQPPKQAIGKPAKLPRWIPTVFRNSGTAVKCFGAGFPAPTMVFEIALSRTRYSRLCCGRCFKRTYLPVPPLTNKSPPHSPLALAAYMMLSSCPNAGCLGLGLHLQLIVKICVCVCWGTRAPLRGP
jgi:hypothetical protein